MIKYLITAICILFCLYIFPILWKRRWLYYHSFKAPGPTPALPILGNVLPVALENVNHRGKKLFEMYDRMKPFGRLWAGPDLYYLLTKPEDIQTILNTHLKKESLHVYEILKKLVGNGLITAPPDVWKKNRKLNGPIFSQQNLNQFVEIFDKQLPALFDEFNAKSEENIFFDPFDLVLNYTMLTVLGALFGIEEDAKSMVSLINRGLQLLSTRIFNVFLHFNMIWKLHSDSKELQQIVDYFEAVVRKQIGIKRQPSNDVHETGQMKTVLSRLVELGKDLYSNQAIADEIITYGFAATETTAINDTFALVMLGMYPEIQDKVYKEVISIVGDSETIDYTDLPKMEYLERVLKETLRVFPPIPQILRSADKDIKLEQYTIPAGSSLIIPILLLHRDPNYWSDPLKFDPDRFLPEEVAKRPSCSYLPFASGPRTCLGIKFAMMSMKFLIASIVKRYKIFTSIKSIDDIKLKINIELKSLEGFPIRLEHRNCTLNNNSVK